MFGAAFRSVSRQPGFHLLVVLILALGVGAATAIFSVVHAVVLAPLPYPGADRIVSVHPVWKDTGRVSAAMSGPDYLDVAEQCDVCEVVAYYFGGETAIRVGASGEFARVFLVTNRFFDIFGTKPAAGSIASANDGAVVLSYAFAQKAFGGPQQALGRTLQHLDRSYEIAAVMPPGFAFPERADIWAPASAIPMTPSRTAHNYRVLAKMRDGVSMDTAMARIASIGDRLSQTYPKDNGRKRLAATPLKDQLTRGSKTTLYALMGAVLLLLLIACANVASLLLARGVVRVRELAVRAALGATRTQLVRQLTVESVLLGLAGCVAGVLLAYAGTDALLALAPRNTPRLDSVTINSYVLLFALVTSLVASVIFGLMPAMASTRVDLAKNLKQGGTRGLLGGGSHRLRSGIVVAEIALSFLLATGGALLFRSFLALNHVDLGYQPEGRLVLSASLEASGLEGHQRTARELNRAAEAVRRLPGVMSASMVMGLPNGPYGSNGAYMVEGVPVPADWTRLPQAGFRVSGPGYFRTLGIPLLRGRDFSESDIYDSDGVAVVSESLVRQSFRDVDPLGKRIKCGLDRDIWMTIVGVVRDARNDTPSKPPQPEIFMPLEQHPYYANDVHLVIRSAVPPMSLAEPARRAIQQVNAGIALKQATMQEMLAESVALPRFQATLFITFASIAMVLAVAGVYGLMSYSVARRQPEFGLRLALGASGADLARLTLLGAMRLIGAGLVLGIAMALILGRSITAMLYGVRPTDLFSYAGAAAMLLVAASLSALIPARRTLKLDPVVALREE